MHKNGPLNLSEYNSVLWKQSDLPSKLPRQLESQPGTLVLRAHKIQEGPEPGLDFVTVDAALKKEKKK